MKELHGLLAIAHYVQADERTRLLERLCDHDDMQASWLDGDAGRMRQRWQAASPVGNARHVRTPVLLVYAEAGNLAAQGEAWRRALTSAGAENKLIMVPGADHTFSSGPARQRLTQAVAEWFEHHR